MSIRDGRDTLRRGALYALGMALGCSAPRCQAIPKPSAPPAGAKTEAAFKMPREQVLKLGLDKFEDVYTTRTHDTSTLGMKRGYAYYLGCRRADNELRARPLSAAQRGQLKTLRGALSELTNGVYNLLESRAGGGTIYSLGAAGALASHEDLIGSVLDTLLHPPAKNAALRSHANALLQQAEVAVTRLATPPTVAGPTPNAAENKRLYLRAYASAQQALAQLRTMTATLPDVAAERVALHVQKAVQDAVQAGQPGGATAH